MSTAIQFTKASDRKVSMVQKGLLVKPAGPSVLAIVLVLPASRPRRRPGAPRRAARPARPGAAAC